MRPRCQSSAGLAERLNRHWSTAVLLVVALLVFVVPVFVPRSRCAIPPHFTSSWVDFALEECTYTTQFPMAMELIPDTPANNTSIRLPSHSLPVYCWAPAVLALMALVLQVNFLIWSQLMAWFATDLWEVVSSVAATQKQQQQHFKGNRDVLSSDDKSSSAIMASSDSSCAIDGTENAAVPTASPQTKSQVRGVLLDFRSGSRTLTSLLLLARKLCTFFASLVLFILVQVLVNPLSLYIFYKPQFHGVDRGALPYQSVCTVTITPDSVRELRCVHPANLVLRQIFVALSAFLAALFLFNLFDLLLWGAMLFVPSLRDRKLSARVCELESVSQTREGSPWESGAERGTAVASEPVRGGYHSGLNPQFASYLGFDGFLLLILANQMAGQAVWAELVLALWQEFKVSEKSKGDLGKEAKLSIDCGSEGQEAKCATQEPTLEEGAKVTFVDEDFKVISLSDEEEEEKEKDQGAISEQDDEAKPKELQAETAEAQVPVEDQGPNQFVSDAKIDLQNDEVPV